MKNKYFQVTVRRGKKNKTYLVEATSVTVKVLTPEQVQFQFGEYLLPEQVHGMRDGYLVEVTS